MGEPDADFDALLAEQGELMEVIEPHDGWELDARIEQAMDALRCPPGDADVTGAVRWGAPPRRAVQAAARGARPAAARRAHQPPRRRERGVAGAAPGEVRRHRPRGHPRPVLPRQRRRVDPRARPRPRLPLRGQLLHLPGDQGDPAQGRGREGRQAREAARETSWSGSARAPRPARPRARPGWPATRRWPPRPTSSASSTSRRSRSRRARGSGDVVIETTHLTKGFGDRVLIDDLSFTLPRNGIVGVVGPERRRQDDAVQDAGRPGDSPTTARSRSARPSRSPTSSRTAVPARPAKDACGRSSPTASTTSRSATSRCRRGPTCRSFGFKGPDQQKPVGVLSGGERNRLNLALTLKQGGNLLLLDEPTNDLDVETLTAAGGCAAGVPRLRRGRQPRPVVPRPGGHAHPGLRG